MALSRVRWSSDGARLRRLKEALHKSPTPALLQEIQSLQEAIEAERRLYRAEL